MGKSRPAAQPPDVELDVEELTRQTSELKDQVRLLRLALDEFHTDFMWAVGNMGLHEPKLPYQLVNLPLDPTPDHSRDAASPPTAEASHTSAIPEEEEVTAEEESGPAPENQQVDDGSARKSNRRRSVQPTQPLYVRVMQRHMTDVFRAIGYGESSLEEVQRRFAPLMDMHGKEKVEVAALELTEPVHDRPGFYRLSAAARPFAAQLLGREEGVGGCRDGG